MNSYDILAALYGILSNATANEIDAASRQVRSQKRLYVVLKSLADERRKIEREGTRKAVGKSSSQRVAASRSVTESGSTEELSSARENVSRREILAMIEDIAALANNNQDLAQMLNTLGLGFRFNKSDGRPRMMRKVSRAIEEASSSNLARVFDRATRVRKSYQTEGWYRLIRDE